MKIGVMHGPNLGRLGERQPDIYGGTSLEALHQQLSQGFPEIELLFYQSNHEGALIDQLESWHDAGVQRLVINPGALTHQSYALRDAIIGLGYLAIEVHISNVHRRERFRTRSLTAPACLGQITGLGTDGYRMAVQHLACVASADQI